MRLLTTLVLLMSLKQCCLVHIYFCNDDLCYCQSHARNNSHVNSINTSNQLIPLNSLEGREEGGKEQQTQK